MQPNRLRLGAIAAWLGVIALSLDALVPIHLAFDLAHAFETATHREDSSPAEHDFSWRLLALVTGHTRTLDGKAGSHVKHHRRELRGLQFSRHPRRLRPGRHRPAVGSDPRRDSDSARNDCQRAARRACNRLPLPRSPDRIG